MLEDNISSILSKFTFQSCVIPLEIKEDINIYSSDSVFPDFYLKSSIPFDKNLCFINVKLTTKLKENLFPKIRYKIPDMALWKLPKLIEKINLDDLFGNVKKISIDVFADYFNLDNIEESLLRQKIKEIIATGKVVPYEKKKTSEALLAKREWYLLGMRTFGPFQDKEVYGFLKRYCNTENQPGTKFMIWEAIHDIFYTPETCLEKIVKLYGIPANLNNELIFNENIGVPLNDFEAMKNNIRMNERHYSVSLANQNFKMRIPYRKYTKDLNGMNMGLAFQGHYDFASHQNRASFNRTLDRKRSYQMQNYQNLSSKNKISNEDKIVKKIIIDPFADEDELEINKALLVSHQIEKTDNVKTLDITSLFD